MGNTGVQSALLVEMTNAVPFWDPVGICIKTENAYVL